MEQGKLDMVMTLRLFLLIFAPNSLFETGGGTLFFSKTKKKPPENKRRNRRNFLEAFPSKKNAFIVTAQCANYGK